MPHFYIHVAIGYRIHDHKRITQAFQARLHTYVHILSTIQTIVRWIGYNPYYVRSLYELYVDLRFLNMALSCTVVNSLVL